MLALKARYDDITLVQALAAAKSAVIRVWTA